MTAGPFESEAAGRAESVAAVEAALIRWRRQLAQVGGPNTLLWYADPLVDVLELTTAHPGGVSMLLAGRPTRLSDLVRERAAFAEARKRAARIRARGLELRTRRGLDTVFLTAGMATWERGGGASPPRAPVLLRSCTLRPTDARASDFDVVLGDDVEVNPVLVEYLRSTAGIELDAPALAETSRLSSGFDPYRVYAALGGLCQAVPGFTVAPRVIVGTFPHDKHSMVADLGDVASPESLTRLAARPVVVALAERAPDAHEGPADRIPSDVPVVPVESSDDLDPDPDPAGEHLVLDADGDQGAVVDTVLRGEDLLVHAPPGTGTTQTIANLVAALAGQGRSVLLVAEPRSEADAVRQQLEGVGLGSLVFDAADALFDHRGTLQRVLGLLEAPSGGASWADRVASDRPVDQRLRSHRDALREHVAALHERRLPWRVSAYEAQCAVTELGMRTPPPASHVLLRGAALARLSRARVRELADELSAAVSRGAWSAGQAGDAWFGARVSSDEDVARAGDIVTRLHEGELDAAAATLDGILAESGLPPASTPDDWKIALATMTGVRDTLEVFRPEIFDVPLDEHVAATARSEDRRPGETDLGWWQRSRVRRQAVRLLRPGRPPEDLHAELVRARTQRTAWHALVGVGARPELSPRLDEAREAYARLEADLRWLGERLAGTADGGGLAGTSMGRLRDRLSALAERPERLAVLPQVVPVLDELRAAGMGEVVEDFAARGVEADQVGPELEHIWWVSVLREVAERDPRYGRHDGPALREAAEAFRAADREHLAATARRIRRESAAGRQAAVDGHREAAAALQAEAQRPGRPSSLRSAVAAGPELVLGAAPCWAMSPLVVAQVVPPGPWFDVVVVAAGGTTTTAVTASALSRARQVVVFGDPSGSGPTEFATGVGAEPAPAGRSLLHDLAGRLPVLRLRQGHAFADDRLLTLLSLVSPEADVVGVPSPELSPPVTLELVDGRAAVEPGHDTAVESTDAEVQRVVELVLAHVRSAPEESLGVVALTERHAVRVRAALEEAVGALSPADDAGLVLAVAAASVTVVPMTAAAAWSWDAVVLSVGYGRTPHGRVLHRFAALSSPTARRELATAVSSARRRLTVVSSFAASDLDDSRLQDGGLLLQEILRYAAAEPAAADPADEPDPLMRDLADRLRREGLVVADQVGAGRRRVELAVTLPTHTSRWLVAVESDGPAYAGRRGTRERDRLWSEALERRGWRTVRVWSTDLFRDPAREVARVVAAVREAAQGVAADSVETGVESGSGAERLKPPTPDSRPTESAPAPTRQPPEQTRDDTDVGWGDAPSGDAHDRWLEEQRPPHWE